MRKEIQPARNILGDALMEPSTTFTATIVDGEKRALLIVGRKRFGPPDAATLREIESVADMDRVEVLLERVSTATCWSTLLHGTKSKFLGIRGIEVSSYYQAIFEEGRAEGELEGRLEVVRGMILRLGKQRFGAPSNSVVEAIESINDIERARLLAEQCLSANSWANLLST